MLKIINKALMSDNIGDFAAGSYLYLLYCKLMSRLTIILVNLYTFKILQAFFQKNQDD